MSAGTAKKVWTKTQECAIGTRGQAILVSAGAGSGKTAVLVERVIRYILEEKGDIDRLLMVTFTEAAAAEMRERIARAIRTAAVEHDQPEQLARQMHLLERAFITTLHGFCLQVIRRVGLQSPAGPGFRVADEQETGMLRDWVLDQLLEDQFASGASAFLAFAQHYGGAHGDHEVRAWILRLYAFARSQPAPEGWLRAAVRDLRRAADGPLAESHLAPAFFASLRQTVYVADRWLLRALTVTRQPGGPHTYESVLVADRERLQHALRAIEAHDFEGCRLALASPFPSLRADKESDQALRELVQGYRTKAKDAVGQFAKGIGSRSQDQLLGELTQTIPHMELLTDLTLLFHARYDAAKRERGIADFADLEHFAYSALAAPDGGPSTWASEWAQRFDEIMVDEYQDTSPIQDAIIGRIAGEGSRNLFQVGDVKQSIYRFRMAEPGLFLRKYETYGSGPSGMRVDLKANFRSRPEIVRAVNTLFSQFFSKDFGGLVYDEDAQMEVGATYPPASGDTRTLQGAVEVILLDRTTDTDTQEEQGPADEEAASADQGMLEADQPQGSDAELADADAKELSTCEQEARVIAQRIQALRAAGTHAWHPDTGAYEPLRFSDIAVLLRANGGRIEVFSRVFRQFGIPCTAETGGAAVHGYEMRLALALMALLDNPRQDIALASVLTSPIAGFDVNDLARVRLFAKGDLYRAVRAGVRGALPPLRSVDLSDLIPRLKDFWLRIERWRTIARRERVGDALAQVLSDSGLLAYAYGLPDGAKRVDHLQGLIEQARVFDAVEASGLSGFVRFISSHPDLGGSVASSGLPTQLDTVRIMTIHKSKGLEFPVVFVATLEKGLEPPKRQGAIILHRTLGFGPQLVDLVRKERYDTLASLALVGQERQETLAEEARVLYVALTRARERLILVGSVRNLEAQSQDWRDTALTADAIGESGPLSAAVSPFSPTVMLSAHAYLDWLMPALYRSGGERDGLFTIRWITRIPGEPGAHVPSEWDVDAYAKVARLLPGALQWMEESGSQMLKPEDAATQDETSGHPTDAWQAQLWAPDLADLTPIAAKWSVTELKRALSAGMDDADATDFSEPIEAAPETAVYARRKDRLTAQVPRFIAQIDGQQPTGAQRGTAFHWIMEHVRLTPDLAQEGGVAAQLQALFQAGHLAAGEVDASLLMAAQRFFLSTLGRRLLNPLSRVLREAAFTMAVPIDAVAAKKAGALALGIDSGALLAAQSESRPIIVQGTLDCLVVEQEGCLLLDYKTDRLRHGRALEEAIDRYRLQLDLYAQAVQRAVGRPVTEKVIYFVDAEKAVCL